MPKRSNDFQDLIGLLHRQLAPEGATVTESNLVADPVTGGLREVDVTIDYRKDGNQVRIAVECRDHARPADVGWIDALIGKYLHSASKVVAVSRRGFSRQARIKATAVGVETMTIAKATDTNWTTWVKGIDTIWFDVDHFDLAGLRGVTYADPKLDGSRFMGIDPAQVRFVRPNGEDMGTVEGIFLDEGKRPDLAEVLARGARQADGLIRYGLRLPAGSVARFPNNETHEVVGLHLLVKDERETISVPLKPGEYWATSVATGQATGKKWKVTVAIVRGEDGLPKTAIRLASSTGVLPKAVYRLFGVGDPIPPPPST